MAPDFAAAATDPSLIEQMAQGPLSHLMGDVYSERTLRLRPWRTPTFDWMQLVADFE